MSQVEVVAASGSGSDRTIRRIGKGRRVSESESSGEFAGHTGCSSIFGQDLLIKAVTFVPLAG